MSGENYGTAMTTGKIKLPKDVVTELIPKVKAKSIVATLCPAEPKKFSDSETIIFTPSAEAEVVEEGAAKGSYTQETSFVTGKRVKVQTTTRVSDELQWADEDNQLEIIQNLMVDQTDAIARAVDYVALNAINPKTGAALNSGYQSIVGGTGHVVTQTSTGAEDMLADLDDLLDALIDYNFNGIAMCRQYVSDLRKLRNATNHDRIFESIPMGLDVTDFEGLNAVTSNNVFAPKATVATNVLAILGDWSCLRWGMVRDMWSEIITMGDPDGAGDLKRYNQVAYRTEAVFCYGILDPNAFAVLKSA